MNAKPKGRILIIRGGAIGDFILTLPVLTALRQAFPEAHLELLGYPHIASLAKAAGLVDGVRGLEERGFAHFFARGVAFDPNLAGYFAGFTVIISYLYDPDGIFEGNVTSCSSAQFIAGPHRPSEALATHAADVFLKPLERLAIFDTNASPSLAIGPAVVVQSPCPTIALHPGSGSERKNWPEQSWRWLIQQLLEQTRWNLLILGGEAEGVRLEQLAPANEPRVALNQNRPLVEVAGVLSGANAFVGHDSGITHLAAALGLPGLALWGVSNEAIWHPRSARFRVLRSPGGIASITADRVFGELRTLIQESNSSPSLR